MKRTRKSKTGWSKRILFGAVVLAATFGAGYLMAGSGKDAGAPRGRLLIPAGFKVDDVHDSLNGIFVRGRDAAGATHTFLYSRGKGDRKIGDHYMFAEVPAEQAFD